MNLTSHILLVPKLSVSGATPLLHPYAFMAWTRPTLPLPLYLCVTGIYLAAVKYLKVLLNSLNISRVVSAQIDLENCALLGY